MFDFESYFIDFIDADVIEMMDDTIKLFDTYDFDSLLSIELDD